MRIYFHSKARTLEEVNTVAEMKREALARLQKALEAHDKGLITASELIRIEFEVLHTTDVKPQNVKNLKEKFRGSLVKNS